MSTIKTDNEDLVLHAEGVKDVEIQTNGSTKLTVKSNGNVGIGTSSPATKLEVKSGYLSQTDGTITTFMGSDGSGSLFGTTTNHYQRFITNNTERMRITSDGIMTMPFQPAFKVNAEAYESLGTSWQQISYNSSLTQRGSANYSTATGRFTAPVSGWYQFNATWSAQGNSDGDGTLSMFINNSTSNLISSVSEADQANTVNMKGKTTSGCAYLSAGDYVSVHRYSTASTVTRGASPYSGWFSGYLIS